MLRAFLAVLLLVMITLSGCSRRLEPTPDTVTAHYLAVVDSLAGSPPGVASHRMETFLLANGNYTIADTVQTEIERLRASAAGTYREARELARQGEFEQAELILYDLAAFLSDTPDGESAVQHLAFDFPYGKAQWLLTRQRFDECEVTARALLEKDLTPAQANQVEAILDNLGFVDAAVGLAERSDAQNACRQLSVMLATRFVEEGQYPSRLTIEDVKGSYPHESEYILRGLSAIEEYRASDRGFSFVGVSKGGRHRLRVTDGRIQGD